MEIAGFVTITKASDESEITHYSLYWGSSELDKIETNPLIGEFSTTGFDITHKIDPDTAVPAGTSHLLLYSKNQEEESEDSVSVTISDQTETEYTFTEGTILNPIDLSSDTYQKEIGQGKSYYSYTLTNSQALIEGSMTSAMMWILSLMVPLLSWN